MDEDSIKWEYKDKVYYFDFSMAVVMTFILIILPLIYAWFQGFISDMFSDPIFCVVGFFTFCFSVVAIYKSSVKSYYAYYYKDGERIKTQNPAGRRGG